MKKIIKLKKEWVNIIFNLMFIIISISVVILLHNEIILTNVALIIIFAIGLMRWKSKLSLVIFILFGLIFGIGEIIVSGNGPWEYKNSDFLNVPSWLFILWGNTAVFIHQMSRELIKVGIK